MSNRSEVRPGFADIAYANRRRRVNFLDKVNELIEWKPIQKKLNKILKRKPNPVGAQPYPAIVMFKALLLQSWYNLSDTQTEDCLADRASFSVFAGLSLDHGVPDSSTICRFRNLLKDDFEGLLNLINAQLAKQDFIIKEGMIADASIVESSCRPVKHEEVELPENEDEAIEVVTTYSRDSEARWTVKGSRSYYGYKAHVSTDNKHGFVLSAHVSAANVYDGHRLPRLVEDSQLDEGSLVIADKGYCSEANRAYLAENEFLDGIMRKAARNRALSEAERAYNKVLSRMRAKVERVFGTLKSAYGFRRSRYIGIAKVEAELLLKSIAFNLKKAALLMLAA